MSLTLINEMLSQLKSNRESISNQIVLLTDIKEQSNNVLLQMELEQSNEMPIGDGKSDVKAYSYNKDMEGLFAKTIELYQRTKQSQTEFPNNLGFADYISQNLQNKQYLSNNVRKMTVISDIMIKATEKETITEDDVE